VTVSRVTESPSGEPDERVPDCLAIHQFAITEPAEADKIVDRRWRNHYLQNHCTAPAALSTATLPLGSRRDRTRQGRFGRAFHHS
jgi:hypothetical protein